MTQNHQTNGASLEDCHTNFFALADLCGIKWKKLVLNERPQATADPLDDPVLKSYTKCLAKDILCVWRRVSQHKNDLDQTGGGGLGMFDISQNTTVTHPPLSLTAAKELWIFWYGEEPDLIDLVSPELLKSSDLGEQGSWESGLSYECRSLLFKALHNLIERCLLSRDIIRLGKWFVQPVNNDDENSTAHLSFSFAFFVHGDSTVCASMDIREHPPVRHLTEEDLSNVIKSSEQNADNCSLDGTEQKDEINMNNKAYMQSVILAPFGLSAVLSGTKSSNENIDQYAEKIINDWNTFYPMKKLESDILSSKMPLLVEVISGGVKMLYPSKYVLITDIDVENKNKCTNENKKCLEISRKYKTNKIETDCMEQSFSDGIQKSVSGVLPERVWQDVIMNPAYTTSSTPSSSSSSSSSMTAATADKCENTKGDYEYERNNGKHSINAANFVEGLTTKSEGGVGSGLWNFVEPCLKNSCACKRSGKQSAGNPSLSGKSSIRSNSNRTRTPFHKRSESSTSKLIDGSANESALAASKKFNIRSADKNSSAGNGGGAGVGSETQQMSIGSVGTASPMQHNSQPSSIQVNEQNAISPTQQNDASHPSTPIIENNTDQKPEIENFKTAQEQNKSENSQQNASHGSDSLKSSKQSDPKENQRLKRPSLLIRDCENNADEDFSTNQSLYDYSTWDAWMNHPIKRFKSDDSDHSKFNNRSKVLEYDLYANQNQTESSNLPFSSQNNFIAQNSSGKRNAWKSCEEQQKITGNMNFIKETKNEHDAEKLSADSLFTSEGLQPSYADLNKIFDNSDDNSNDDHLVDNTPPGSNKSIGCHPDLELSEHEIKREKMTFGNFNSLTHIGQSTSLNNVNSGSNNVNALGLIRNEELSKMFPTPPSIEQHTNSSPGGICGNIADNLMESIDTTVSHKNDSYPNFGSPLSEPIEDWTYVFIPPKMSNIIGSSKYAPLNNLLSQTQPPIILPNDSTYKPSWVKQREQEELRRNQKESSNTSKMTEITVKREITSTKPPAVIDVKKEIKMEPMSPMSGGKPNLMMANNRSMKPSSDSSNTIINKLLSSKGPNISSTMYLNHNRMSIHSPLQSPSTFQQHYGSSNSNSSNGSSVPMGPSDSMFRKSLGMQHCQPPPPYDVAIHSPSLNSNISATNSDDVINNNNNSSSSSSKRISNHKGGPMLQQRQNHSQNISEASSLLVNVLLYDTSLNIFRDHNFDSCTICVCNATPKCVGNIRGLDSGMYLSLASNCHFHLNNDISDVVEKTFEPKSNVCSSQQQQQFDSKYMGSNCNLVNAFTSESPCLKSNISKGMGKIAATSSNPLPPPQLDLIPITYMNNSSLNLNGYADDDPIFCRCGFSAVINRRLAHQTGLFYEDEMEITGMAKDPSNFKRKSLLALLMRRERAKGGTPNSEGETKPKIGENGAIIESDKDTQDLYFPKNVSKLFDIVRDQCTIFQNSSDTIQRTIKHMNQERYSPLIPNKHVNILEFIDAFDIVSLALEQSKCIFEKFDGYNNRQMYVSQHQQKHIERKSMVTESTISVHKWPFLNAAGPKSNQDIIRVMKSMKVLLQKAFNQNGTTGLWDAPYAVRGPLTWREFHRLAGRGIGQCEPQPVPSLVVGHDKEWLCISPYALQFWDKLLLEPYSYPRDIAYVIVTPDNEFINSKVKTFFKELSTTYEMCRLGKHQPIKGWEGVLKVGKAMLNGKLEYPSDDDDWLHTIDSNGKLNELMKMYAVALQQHLVPYLSKIPQDKSLLNPPESFYNYKDHHHHHHQRASASLPSPMLPPHTPESNNSLSSGNLNSCDTPKSDHDMDLKENLNSSSINGDVMSQSDQPLNPPHVVLYIVEPFTTGTDSTNLERIACLSLLKLYSNVLNAIPESIKSNVSIQIIAQESIAELGKDRNITRWSDHMRNLALNVFTRSYRYLSHTNNVKSLTGFGTAAVTEAFLKTKEEKNLMPLRLYTPPYILSTRQAKSENADNFGQSLNEQQCSIMYCCYCLSEDQSMLLAVITDERGEFLENCAINIDIPNRKRRRKTSARRIGLKKLMDFILGVMSQTVKSWRLVIGRIGRIGHSELKGWSWLLSKPNLVKASKYLKDICKQCSVMYSQAVPSIWSACLVTLEPDSNFRVMPDQFTPDERFSQRSTQSPLSTPQDVTCTHILVFPTSAISQSSQTAFQEQHLENALDFGEDLGILGSIDDTDDVEDDINGIQHLFDECWNDSAVGIPQASPTRDRGSPINMDENKSRQSPGMLADPQSGSSRSMPEQEEVGQLLQQPLALGYLVSTAPTGRMPTWFWASCPHLETVCPVFLKTALHIHSPSIHRENDDIYFKEQSSKVEHPLDSNTTADVLRYVLEGYNVLSWLAMDSNTHDRLSCLPIHVQMLMQLYHLHNALA